MMRVSEGSLHLLVELFLEDRYRCTDESISSKTIYACKPIPAHDYVSDQSKVFGVQDVLRSRDGILLDMMRECKQRHQSRPPFECHR